MESFGIEVTDVRRRRKGGGPFLAGAAVHLNFVAQKYYWNGAARTSADFAGYTGGTFDGTGLTFDGVAANFDYSVSMATLNIAFPCAVIAVFTPASVTGNQFVANLDLDVNNSASVGISGIARIAFVVTGGVQQASVGSNTAVIGTRLALAGNFETNNILASTDGTTAGTADTSATLPASTSLHVGDRLVNASPLTGTIHHVLIFSGAKTQTELNDLCAQAAYLR